MKNTYCKECAFGAPANDKAPCEFDIIEHIAGVKTIEIKEGYNYIYDYTCRYGIGKEVIENNPELKHLTNIKDHLIQRAWISYYLIIDIRPVNDKLDQILNLIKALDIKPKFISFVNHDFENTPLLIKKISNNIDESIKWKIHNFIVDLPLEKILNVIVDTNTEANGSKIFHVYEPSLENINTDLLNKRINFMHFTTIVEQKFCHGFFDNKSSIDGLSLPFMAFKQLYNCETKSIMSEIEKQQQIKLLSYNYNE